MRARSATAKPRPERPRQLGRWVLAILVAVVVLVALFRNLGAENRAISRMDPLERRAVYEHVYGEVRRLCGAGPRDDALEAQCQEQIRFVLQFPECDAECQAIARRHTPLPTK